LRRITDILVALLALSLLAPLLLVITVTVIVFSPGNPFYLGRRAGKGGKNFRMWKFRTMVANAARVGPSITVKNDSRITPFGRFLRKTKLDELPQFLNVLIGNMTLVGPRPELPEIVALYDAQQREVLSVKPGVTGPVQLKLGLDESEAIPEGDRGRQHYVDHLMGPKIRVDLEYLRTRTSLTDAHVLLDSAALVLRRLIARRLGNRRGAETAIPRPPE
jgi:lipopolysaccharide/colanic/teichoic acid biosynthesis glycosyltransferase